MDSEFSSVRAIAERVHSGECSARQVVEQSLQKIDASNDRLRAFLRVDSETALNRADEIDARISHSESVGPLAGVPIAVKDNICDRDGLTTCASKILANYRSPYDAHVIEQLHRADAVIVGKTNLDEFAMGSSTENSGRFTTRNPWNPEFVPGGSSGGSTAAVAGGMVPLALGSDTGGSIRQPASLCGVVGLKPTYGRVSRYGLVAFGSSLDQIGPIARNADDAAILLGVLAGHDPRDSTSVDEPIPDFSAALNQPIAGLRIGIAAEYFGQGLDDEVRARVQAAVENLGGIGAEIREVHLPHLDYSIACYYLIANAEASSNLARYDGVHFGHRTAEPTDYIDLYCSSRAEGFGAEVKRRIMLGTYALSSGYYDAYYLRALKVRTLICNDFTAAFQNVDVLASPISPVAGFRIGERSADPLSMYLADVYTVSANLAGIPAISIPCGFSNCGLPIGLQLMGPPFSEARLLQIAHAYQQETDWHTHRPPVHSGGCP